MNFRSVYLCCGALTFIALLLTGVMVFRGLSFADAQLEALDAIGEIEADSLEIGLLVQRHNRSQDRMALRELDVAVRAFATRLDSMSVEETGIDGLEALRALAVDMREVVRHLRLVVENDIYEPRDAARGSLHLLDVSERFLEIVSETHSSARAALNERIDGARSRIDDATLMLLALGAVLWPLLLWLWLSIDRRLLRPLAVAREEIARLGSGALHRRLAVRSQDEIGALRSAINAMAEDLQRTTASRAELESEVALRRRAEAALRKHNERLVEINHDLDKFAYIASHDLRSPLRGVHNLAQWIEEDLGEAAPAEVLGHLDKLKGRAARLEGLLDALLQYNRIGRVAFQLETVDPQSMVESIAELLDPEGAWDIAFEGDPGALETHRAPLELVLRNLMSNAMKHHDRQPGRVLVRAHRVGERRCFEVIDDGPGVPEDLQERIFEMFQTLKPRDTVEGSGMGLALVRKTARIYGSAVTLVSPVENGRGAAFSFTWPESGASMALTPESDAPRIAPE